MTLILLIIAIVTSCAIGFTFGYFIGRDDEEIDDGY